MSAASKRARQGVTSPYLDTLDRMEPDIAMVDQEAALASIAISLKRLADKPVGFMGNFVVAFGQVLGWATAAALVYPVIRLIVHGGSWN